MTLMEEVRNLIAVDHDRIEKTNFSIAMMASTISSREYAFGLGQLWHVHHALEQSIDLCPELSEYFSDEMRRTATIARDLKSFGTDIGKQTVLPSTNAAIAMICSWAVSTPYALLGALYVMEGSRMGSLVIARPLAKSLGLQAGSLNGIEYHLEGASTTPARVRSLKESLNTKIASALHQQQLRDGAVRLMSLLLDIYQAIPVSQPSLNPIAA